MKKTIKKCLDCQGIEYGCFYNPDLVIKEIKNIKRKEVLNQKRS